MWKIISIERYQSFLTIPANNALIEKTSVLCNKKKPRKFPWYESLEDIPGNLYGSAILIIETNQDPKQRDAFCKSEYQKSYRKIPKDARAKVRQEYFLSITLDLEKEELAQVRDVISQIQRIERKSKQAIIGETIKVKQKKPNGSSQLQFHFT